MIAATLFSLLLAAVPIHGAAVSDIQKRTALTDCLTAASVPQNLPGSADFTQAIKPFNLRIPFTPIAVAVPTTVSQVQAAVACGHVRVADARNARIRYLRDERGWAARHARRSFVLDRDGRDGRLRRLYAVSVAAIPVVVK